MPSADLAIKLLDLSWISGEDDPADLCAHGHVFVKIGDEILSNKESGIWSVSATAIYLLRTLERDYQANDFSSQLLPYCSHSYYIDEDRNEIVFFGCPTGIDWTIIHTEYGKIKHVSDNGSKANVDWETYKNIVLVFADAVEAFYQMSLPKTLPDDKDDVKGYQLFWDEWHRLRNKYP